jgi:hypothetical protein
MLKKFDWSNAQAIIFDRAVPSLEVNGYVDFGGPRIEGVFQKTDDDRIERGNGYGRLDLSNNFWWKLLDRHGVFASRDIVLLRAGM